MLHKSADTASTLSHKNGCERSTGSIGLWACERQKPRKVALSQPHVLYKHEEQHFATAERNLVAQSLHCRKFIIIIVIITIATKMEDQDSSLELAAAAAVPAPLAKPSRRMSLPDHQEIVAQRATLTKRKNMPAVPSPEPKSKLRNFTIAPYGEHLHANVITYY